MLQSTAKHEVIFTTNFKCYFNLSYRYSLSLENTAVSWFFCFLKSLSS